MAYRILDLAPSHRNLQGDATASGGTLYFYTTGTNTPKAAYGAKALTGAMFSITLDSAGRTNGDVWGDGSYRVTLKDALGATIWSRDDVELPGGVSAVVPVPNTDEFLTGDGTNYALASIREVPDPTGQANKILSTDGTALFWVTKPADGAAGTNGTSPVNAATNVLLGTLRIQWGAGSAPASGTDAASASVTFPVAFSAAPYIVIPSVTVASVNGTSLVATSYTGASATGCTINFNNADRHFDGSSKLTSAIPFSYVAIGLA